MSYIYPNITQRSIRKRGFSNPYSTNKLMERKIPVDWRMIKQRFLRGVVHPCGHKDIQCRPHCPHCLPYLKVVPPLLAVALIDNTQICANIQI